MLIRNAFGDELEGLSSEDSAKRTGKRIRTIRTARGLTQGELGERVGLSSDRIQKYENGIRKPKLDLLKKMADALSVETMALADPVTSNYCGAMHTLFEMEEPYELQLSKDDSGVSLRFRNADLSEFLEKWYDAIQDRDEGLASAGSEEEREKIRYIYNTWKWTFPEPLLEERDLGAEKARIKGKIEELQKQLAKLED